MALKSRTGIALFGSLLLAACGTAGGSAFSQDANNANLNTSLKTVAQQTSQRFTAYITGYSFWDNTPVGTAAIALPVVHDEAGGQGTYDDPITLAVGHSITGGRSTPDVPAGTRFYIERLQKYAIVEDVCGDGERPQNGPCHTGHQGHPWFDIYVGGERSNAEAAAACARSITDLQAVIINPAPDLPVSAGAVADSTCRKTVAQLN